MNWYAFFQIFFDNFCREKVEKCSFQSSISQCSLAAEMWAEVFMLAELATAFFLKLHLSSKFEI